MSYTTWDVIAILDLHPPNEAGLVEIMEQLPAGSTVAHSPHGDGLRVAMTVLADGASSAAAFGLQLANTALALAGYELAEPLDALSVEVLRGDEAARRGERDLPDPLAHVIDADEAAALLGVTPHAVRQRGEKLGGRKLPGGAWVFHRPTIVAHVNA